MISRLHLHIRELMAAYSTLLFGTPLLALPMRMRSQHYLTSILEPLAAASAPCLAPNMVQSLLEHEPYDLQAPCDQAGIRLLITLLLQAWLSTMNSRLSA